MEQARILAFAGSLRRESFNKKLIAIAASGAERAGAVVTLIDLRDFALPIYDGDLEEASGVPANGVALAELFVRSGSNWSPVTFAVLVEGFGETTRAWTVSVAVAPTAREPTVQTPVAGL